MWDASYRESISDTLQCLEAQTVLEELEIIYIEWFDKINPEIKEYDFISIININSKTKDFDTGIQWNLGLYLAKTDWVAYHHCDIVPANHYEKIINRINKIEEAKEKILWLEGWNVNLIGHAEYRYWGEYENYKKKVNDELHLIPDLYKKENYMPVQPGGGAFTVHKDKFIEAVDGWCWNRKTELWCGPGWPQLNLPHNSNVRNYLKSQGKLELGSPTIYTYLIPHKRTGKYEPGLPLHLTKYYSDFINNWLPEQNLTY